MGRFRTKSVFSILFLVLLISLSYLFLLLQISDETARVESISQMRDTILLAGLVITAIAVLIGWAVAFSLSQGINGPINQIIKTTQAISKIDFDQRLKIRSYTELEELAFNFNHMLNKLRDFQHQVRRQSRDLERVARKRTRELNCIYKICREVASTLELNEVLDMIIKSTAEILDLKICTILLLQEDDGEYLQLARTVGTRHKKVENENIKRGESVSGWVWDKKETLLVKDLAQDSRFLARKKEKYYSGSLIAVPLKVKGKIIGVIIGNCKASGKLFKEEDLLLLTEIAAESAIAIENALLYKNMKQIYLHTISALASALDAKDHYTHSHSENVTKYAVAISEELGLPQRQVETIRQACQLHDLGKIGIHDYILSKKGKLAPEEWDEIKLHSLRGAQILQPIGFLSEVAQLISQHHERLDGKGYPAKLSGEDIQLGARIMTVADSFDAMVSERPYRKALSIPEAIAELDAHSGTQFDPIVVQAFLKLINSKADFVNAT